jgi:riboflavin synthase
MSQTSSKLLHIVMWKLTGATPEARAAQTRQIQAGFDEIRNRVPGIRKLMVGANVIDEPGSYDLALVMEFESHAALEAYNVHPLHLGIKKLMAPMRSERAAIDLALED